jgi:hypothetical protein
VGNKPTPEESVYSTEEILFQGWPMALLPDKDLWQMKMMQAQRESIMEQQYRAMTGASRRLGEKVQVLMSQSPFRATYVLHTNDSRIPNMEIPSYALMDHRDAMVDFIRQYIHSIVRGGFATPEEIDVRIPNLYSHQAELDKEREQQMHMAQQYYLEMQERELRKLQQKQPNPFEVNMVEALVGWKGWKIREENGVLASPSYGGAWFPDKPFEASCSECSEVPHESHSCGVYATDALEGARSYGVIRGEVYGWGRYIRGDKGWRCQFAYPKAFYLDEGQGHLVEQLRAYHVPVYVKQPMLIYSPEEDGYDGHWNSEENGDCRTDKESDAGEAGDQDS